MNSCEYFGLLISRMIDEDLSASEREELARHIDACPECFALYGAFASVSRTIACDLTEPPESLSINVMAQLRRQSIRKVNKPRIPGYWKGIAASAACLAVILFAAFGAQGKLSSGADTAAIYGGSVNTRTETTGATPEDAEVYERIIEAAPVEAEESVPALPTAEPTSQQSEAPSTIVILQDEQPEAAPEPAAPTQPKVQVAAAPTPYESPVPEITLAGSANDSETAEANVNSAKTSVAAEANVNSAKTSVVAEANADSADMMNAALAMPESHAADKLPPETVICDAAIRDGLMKLLSGKKAERPAALEEPKYILRYYDDTGAEFIMNIYVLKAGIFYHSYPAQTAENGQTFYAAACTAADLESFVQKLA